MKKTTISPEQKIVLERYIKEIINNNFQELIIANNDFAAGELLSEGAKWEFAKKIIGPLFVPVITVGTAQAIAFSCEDKTNWFCDISDDIVAGAVTAILFAYGRRQVIKHGEPHLKKIEKAGVKRLSTDITGQTTLFRVGTLTAGAISQIAALYLSWMYWMSPEKYNNDEYGITLGSVDTPTESWSESAHLFFKVFGVDQRKERDAWGLISTFLPWHRLYKGMHAIWGGENTTSTFFYLLREGDDALESVVQKSRREIDIAHDKAVKDIEDIGELGTSGKALDDLDAGRLAHGDMEVLHADELAKLADGASGHEVLNAADAMNLRTQFDSYWSSLSAGSRARLATKADLDKVAARARKDFDTIGTLKESTNWKNVARDIADDTSLKDATDILTKKGLHLKHLVSQFPSRETKKLIALQKLWRGARTNAVPRNAFKFGDDIVRVLENKVIGKIDIGGQKFDLKIVGHRGDSEILVQVVRTDQGSTGTAVSWWKNDLGKNPKTGDVMPRGAGKIKELTGVDWEGLSTSRLKTHPSGVEGTPPQEFSTNFKYYPVDLDVEFRLVVFNGKEGLIAAVNLDHVATTAGNTFSTNQMQAVWDGFGVGTNVLTIMFNDFHELGVDAGAPRGVEGDMDAGARDHVNAKWTEEEKVLLLEVAAEQPGISEDDMRKAMAEAN